MPLKPTHPAGYNAITYPLAGQFKKFFTEMRAGGLWQAICRIRQMNHLRSGRFMGEDHNGNKYYEDTKTPYGRSRWVEPKLPLRVFEMDAHYDSSSVTPEWHGWLHYTTDKPAGAIKAEFDQPWIQPHKQNPSCERETHYTNPGHWKNTVMRGRVGPKYEAWVPESEGAPRALRNYSDNTQTLRIE